MTNQTGLPDPRQGILGRVTGGIYLVLTVELCLVLAAVPGVVAWLFVARVPGNIPLFALCLLPVAPAFSAALYAVRVARREEDLVIWPRFWLGWVRSLRDVLPLWIVTLVIGAVLSYNIAFGAAVGVAGVFIIASWVLLVVLGLWALNATVIATFFSFRLRDVARLALFYLVAKPQSTLGAVLLAVATAGVVYLTADFVVVVGGVLLVLAVLLTHRPVIEHVTGRFVAQP